MGNGSHRSPYRNQIFKASNQKNSIMSKGKQFKETRMKLIELSNVAKQMRQKERLDMTINEILLKLIYNTNGATEFNTFAQWKELGYTILKGSKAFVIWGQPRTGNENKEETDTKRGEGEDDEYSFFPVCYLFSDKQVRKVEIAGVGASKEIVLETNPDHSIDDIL